MNELYDKIIKISQEQEGKTLLEMILKCSEELGELSQAVLSYTGACGCSHKNLTLDNVKEEVVDVFVVITAIIAKVGLSKEEVIGIAENKLIKWQKVINKQEIIEYK